MKNMIRVATHFPSSVGPIISNRDLFNLVRRHVPLKGLALSLSQEGVLSLASKGAMTAKKSPKYGFNIEAITE